MYSFITTFKTLKQDFRIYDYETKEHKTIYKLPNDRSSFYLTQGYEPNDSDLMRYAEDLVNATKELLTTKILTFDYIKPYYMKKENKNMFRSHTRNIISLFNMLTLKEKRTHAPISYTEYTYFEKCYTAGIMFAQQGTYNAFGFDFSNYYGSILGDKESDFMIPTQQGEEKFIKELPKVIKTGFYKVKITCNNPDINKVFAFSKNNVYYSQDIKFARELIKDYGFDIKMELNTNTAFNCYIYSVKNLVKSNTIFNNWYEKIIALKKEFPKNMLLKLISSSLWGHLNAGNYKYLTEEEFTSSSVGTNEKYDYIFVSDLIQSNGNILYKVIPTDELYSTSIRLKPFITSYARIKIARIALQNLTSVVRIHTDGIMYNKDIKQEIKNFIPELKTTGNIYINNVHDYFHICPKCKQQYKYKQYKVHSLSCE